MPEGNTIYRFARDQTRDLAGHIVRVSSPQGRFAKEARRLDGRRFLRAEAYGKHLFHHWRGGLVVHIHLGMAGHFRRFRGRPPEPRPMVRMRLSVPGVTIDLIGPPTCELVTERDRREIEARLGPDPLGSDAGALERFHAAVSRRPDRAIGDALLDQRVAAGVGNIYRIEALFLRGIHPLTPAKKLDPAAREELWKTLGALLRRGVREGTVTVARGEPIHPRAAAGRVGEDGSEDDFYVYGSEVCRRCGGRVDVFPLSGRRMFACRACQPRRRKR